MKAILQNTAFFLKQPASILLKQNLLFSKKNLKYAYLLCSICLLANFLFAQQTKEQKENKEKFQTVNVTQKCATLPREKRVRIRVSHFTVTTSTSSSDRRASEENSNRDLLKNLFGKGGNNGQSGDKVQPTLGDNLATELTSSLQNVNCFRVIDNSDEDSKKEIDKGDEKYGNKQSAAKAGHMLGAQILVKGEVTEYNISSKNSNVMGFGSGKKKVKLGFILKMVNAETNEVIASQPFRIESQTGKSFSVPGYSSNEQDPDVAAVMANGVIQATEYLSRMRDSLNLTADGNFAGNGTSDGSKVTEITLNNANYTTYNSFANILSGVSTYKSMEKSLSGGVGSFTVTHSGSTDAFTSLLSKKIGSNYEILGQEEGKIELKVK